MIFFAVLAIIFFLAWGGELTKTKKLQTDNAALADQLQTAVIERDQIAKKYGKVIDAEVEAQRILAQADKALSLAKAEAEDVIATAQNSANNTLNDARKDAIQIRANAQKSEERAAESVRMAQVSAEKIYSDVKADEASSKSQDEIQLHHAIALQRTELVKLQVQYNKLLSDLETVKQQITQAKVDLVETNEEVLMQSFGLYKPHYEFANSTEYKEALAAVREKQKNSIKNGTAVLGNKGWTVNGDAKKGAKMITDMQKLLLRAFNCECDDVVAHVRFNNVEAAEKRIDTSFTAISKLGAVCGVAISGSYRNLKINELHLAHEYQIEKQKERELLKQLRAEERERVKLEKEIAEARKKVEKEQTHYENALVKVLQQLSHATGEDVAALEAKKAELEEQLGVLAEAMAQIDYREANQKAGYVYIISNVGSFGEGIYKIGMTRRLEPMDRVDELGDASVPFNFDVHALIFSEDAPGLEAALHRAFEDRKLNMVNTRREFFRVSLDEIKKVITDNFDKTVEFVDIPAAEQYRQSELLRRAK